MKYLNFRKKPAPLSQEEALSLFIGETIKQLGEEVSELQMQFVKERGWRYIPAIVHAGITPAMIVGRAERLAKQLKENDSFSFSEYYFQEYLKRKNA